MLFFPSIVFLASQCYAQWAESAGFYPPFYPGTFHTNNLEPPRQFPDPNNQQDFNYVRHFQRNSSPNQNEPTGDFRYRDPSGNRERDYFRNENELHNSLRRSNGSPNRFAVRDRDADNVRNVIWLTNGFGNGIRNPRNGIDSNNFRNDYEPPMRFRNENDAPPDALRNINRDTDRFRTRNEISSKPRFRNGPSRNGRNSDNFRNDYEPPIRYRNENRATQNDLRETYRDRDNNRIRNEGRNLLRIRNEPPDRWRNDNRAPPNDLRETNRDTNDFRIRNEPPRRLRNENRAPPTDLRERNRGTDFRIRNEPPNGLREQANLRNVQEPPNDFRNVKRAPSNGLRNSNRPSDGLRIENEPPISLREVNTDTSVSRQDSRNTIDRNEGRAPIFLKINKDENGLRVGNRNSDGFRSENGETNGSENGNGVPDGNDFDNGNLRENREGLISGNGLLRGNSDSFLNENSNGIENSQQISSANRQPELVNEFNGLLPRSPAAPLGRTNDNRTANGMMAVMPMRAQVMFMQDTNGIDLDGDGNGDEGGFSPRVVMMPFQDDEEEEGMFDDYGGPMTAIGMFGLPALIVIDTIFNFLNSGPNDNNNFDPVDQDPSNVINNFF